MVVGNISENRDEKYYRYTEKYIKTKRKESDNGTMSFGEILSKVINGKKII